MVSQCAKFEVSRFTRYEAINGGAKCRKWGGLGRLGGTQGNVTIRQSAYDFLFDFVVERRSLTGELSLSCARPAADG